MRALVIDSDDFSFLQPGLLLRFPTLVASARSPVTVRFSGGGTDRPPIASSTGSTALTLCSRLSAIEQLSLYNRELSQFANEFALECRTNTD